MKHILFIVAASLFSVLSLFSQAITLQATSFERHVDLSWNNISNTTLYQISRSEDSISFQPVKSHVDREYLHFTSSSSLDNYYLKVEALNASNQVIASSAIIHVVEQKMSDEELLDMVQRYHFKYFWDFAHPSSGMARERNTSEDIVTTGGSGFGIMAILVGIENGYITREQGLNRILKITSFLEFADRFHGVFPHWMNGKNGNVVPFSTLDNGGDLVETAFIMEGLLTARAFFDQDTPNEKAVRQVITKLWEEVEWDFYTKNNSGSLLWHWSPNNNWAINHKIKGYNEALIIYLLAISSPTHSIAPSYWTSGWAGAGYKNGNNYYSISLPVGPAYGGPLFFAHYSYMGFDPRRIKDQYTNYFVQNINHTLINRAYCIKNPLNHKDYSSKCWGLTASDDPNGYLAHEPIPGRDNGTISPTAALSSMPYTPSESLEALKHFYFDRGDKLLGKYGFYDAFNPSKNWIANSFLAIDQGPIVCMIQNYRTELLWKNFMKNDEIIQGLQKIGFVEDLTNSISPLVIEIEAYPNPTSNIVTLIGIPVHANCYIINLAGQTIMTTKIEDNQINFSPLPSGIYFVKIEGLPNLIKVVKV